MQYDGIYRIHVAHIVALFSAQICGTWLLSNLVEQL